MEILSNPFVALAVVIGILVTVHEAGHFIAGRLSGIAVEAFSIGFGPALLYKKIGVTTYKIGLLPFGGYVKFYGMTASEKVPPGIVGKKFFEASYGQKVATLAAGPLANLALAILVYAGLVMAGIPHPQAIIGEIQPGSAAEKAGLRFQDQVVAIDGQKVRTWEEMGAIIARSANKKIDLSVLREGQTQNIIIQPDEVQGEDLLGRKQKVGRAGVVRGAIPSVIAVKGASSAAAVAGLATGMRITQVDVNNERKEVKYWQQFLGYLKAAHEKGEPAFKGLAAPTHKDATPDNSKVVPFTLSLAALACKECAEMDGKDLAAKLGISDAQFVVGDWQQLGNQGLQKDDLLLSWNETPLTSPLQYAELQQANKTPTAKLGVQRGFDVLSVEVKLKSEELQLPSGRQEIFILPVSRLGAPVEPEPWIEQYRNPVDALWFGTREAIGQSYTIAKVIGLLFIGQFPLKALGGPIMIANAAGDAAQAGAQVFMGTIAVISINLALFNAIPFPLFDGGQIVLATIEALRRRRLSEASIENFQRVGFAVLMALIVLATHNDITRYWATMVKRLTGASE